MSPYGDMKPSPTELAILKHLWSAGPQSQGEVHAAVEPELGWSRSSTRKTMERMVEKGMLSQSTVHGVNVYRARLKKIPTLAGMVTHFAREVLGIDGPLPVSNLVKSEVLTPDELEELNALIEAEARKGEGV